MPRTHVGRIITPLALLAALVAAGCSSSTEPTSRSVALRREAWARTKPTSYSYDYEITGYYNPFANHWIHIVVSNDTVRSATDPTGQLEPILPSWMPTINDLFDMAAGAAAGGALRSVRYDPTYGYPAEMRIDGPPDASGTIYAKNLVPSA